MALAWQRALPLKVCTPMSCALSTAHGAVLANRLCPASRIVVTPVLRSSRLPPAPQQRARTSVAMAAAVAQPLIVPPKAQHTGSVIMLHGLGDTGAGWAGISQMFASTLPGVKFIFPTAAERPITLNGGMRMTGWFDLASLDELEQKEDTAGLRDSMQQIEQLVRQEQSAGIDKVVVAGFSQGGAIALLMLRSSVPVTGVAGLSTWLTLRDEQLLSDTNRATPLWMAHGTADQIVRFDYGKRSAEMLKEAGAAVSFTSYRDMGHEARPEELEAFQKWLEQLLN